MGWEAGLEKDFTNLCPGLGGSQVRKKDKASKTKGTLWAKAWGVTHNEWRVSAERALCAALWAE